MVRDPCGPRQLCTYFPRSLDLRGTFKAVINIMGQTSAPSAASHREDIISANTVVVNVFLTGVVCVCTKSTLAAHQGDAKG